MRFTQEEDEHILWAIWHYGSDQEIAFDLGRTQTSVSQHIRDLRKKYDLDFNRRKTNAGRRIHERDRRNHHYS